LHPIQISHSSPGELVIQWQGGGESRIPTRLLRQRCPCASCRTAAGSATIPLLPSSALTIREIILVGSSAIRVIWEDGHLMGIYPYSFLREMVPPSEPS
jgi:DUF971 family protein